MLKNVRQDNDASPLVNHLTAVVEGMNATNWIQAVCIALLWLIGMIALMQTRCDRSSLISFPAGPAAIICTKPA